MTVLVVTPPEPLVTLSEAKAHLRERSDGGDTLIQAYIAAASAHVDGPYGILGRAVGKQTLEVVTYGWPLSIGFGPANQITSITYTDSLGEQAVAPETFVLMGDRVRPATGSTWPSQYDPRAGVRVRYEAGFEVVPMPIKQAVLLIVGQWYEAREAVNIGNIVNELPNGAKALLAPYKVWRM